MRGQILIVGSNSAICQSICEALCDDCTTVTCTSTTDEGLESFAPNKYCLIIMEILLLAENGLDAIRIIRGIEAVPILAIIGKLQVSDKIALFHAGVNAYLERPLDIAVCAAQATSLIRLYREAQAENRTHRPLIFGTELMINPMYRRVIIRGEQIELTRTEFDLLLCLAQHPYQIWSCAQLYHRVWNDDLGISGDNTVRAHMGNLRKKLGNTGKNYIQNSRGVGHKFVPPAK